MTRTGSSRWVRLQTLCTISLISLLGLPAVAGESEGSGPDPDLPEASSGPQAEETYELGLPARFPGSPDADVRVQVTMDSLVAVRAGDLRPILDPALDADGRLALARLGETMVTPEQLERVGVFATFNAETLTIDLEVASARRAWSRVSIAPPQAAGPAAADIRPASISSGITVAAIASGTDGGAARYGANIDAFLNVGGFDGVSLVTGARYMDGGDAAEEFTRTPTLLFKDNWDKALRYSAGDLDLEPASLQGAPGLLGFAIQKRYDLIRPTDNVRQTGQRSLFLETPSTVEVYVNGVPVRTFRASAGPLELADIPFASGANQVELVIEDEFGRVREERFNAFSDVDLLSRGVTEYEFGVGVIRDPVTSGITYTDDFAATGRAAMGLRDNLTLNGQAQASERVQVLGGGAAFRTAAGLFAFDAAVSHSAEAGEGYAASLRYRHDWNAPWGGLDELDMRADYYSDAFDILGSEQRLIDRQWQVGAQYRTRIAGSWGLSLGASYEKAFTEERDVLQVNAGLSAQAGPVSLFGNISYRDSEFTGQETVFSISATMRLGERSATRAGYDSRRERAHIAYERYQRTQIGDLSGRLEFENSRDGAALLGRGRYVGNRGLIDLRADRFDDPEGDAVDETRFEMRLQSGIGFADGRIAMGRDPARGFYIADKHPSLGDAQVELSVPGYDGPAARSGPLGPALASVSSDYRLQRVTIEVDTPVGYDLGPGEFNAFPSSAVGYVLPIGADNYRSAVGTLVDMFGRPVSLASGEVMRLSHAERLEQTLFTNRTGRFALQGLGVGAYRITVNTSPPSVATFEIPAGGSTFTDLGELELLHETVD
jgi:outer membrane usher protein